MAKLTIEIDMDDPQEMNPSTTLPGNRCPQPSR
jgi:hypothetical protein